MTAEKSLSNRTMNVTLRSVRNTDAEWISTRWSPDGLPGYRFPRSREEISALIDEWNTRQYEGKYFEMFLVCADGLGAGLLSLMEQSSASVSVGVCLERGAQGLGIGTQSVNLAKAIAKERGSRFLIAKNRAANAASIALCRKCGFVLVRKECNQAGREVNLWEYNLCQTGNNITANEAIWITASPKTD